MNRRQFGKIIVGLSLVPLIGCDSDKNAMSDPKGILYMLADHGLYGVKILKMLKPNLSDKQLGLNNLVSAYPQLLESDNKDDLVLKANELIHNDFMQDNFIEVNGHMFSPLELFIYDFQMNEGTFNKKPDMKKT